MDIRKMKILDAAIQNKFNINSYIAFLNELFKENIRFNRDLKFNPKVKGQFRQTVESFIDLGICKDTDGNILALAIVKLKSNHTVERARAMQRNFIKDYFLELESGKKVALVAFFDDNSDDWRLSFVKIEAEIENDKLVKKITPAKRYSFLVGKNEKNHTAKKQLWNIFADDSKTPLISDIEQIFSIEKVTNEFYESYRQKYLDLKETLENQESFSELAERLEFTAEQYSKKLMGQLVFLYFLQKKGWLGVRANPVRVEAADIENLIDTNQEQEIFRRVYKLHNGSFIRNGNELKNLSDKEIEVLNNIFRNTKYAEKWGQGEINFIRRIFNAAKDSKENFFKDYLEPLFYEALNDKRGGSTYYRKLNCLIPFLNGGLFKTINADYEWKDTHFVLKNNVFSNETLCKNGDIGNGILDVFDRYAFTVNEAEPLETDVAVDPEMLGKVFENLLDIKDRKSKGAFYTPREIVHYMCQESLINYLQTETQISYGDIEQLIRYGDIIADDDKSKNAQKTGKYLMPEAIRANSKKIDEFLENVKIADPAVGSGAFPLGMVNEILRARSNLNPYIYGNEISLYGNKFSIPMDRRPYQIKLDTIQNCIHAVDIEPSAVDIAKLRLWLSLIVDEENFKEIRPLPNLDYNIMCGNSLIDEFQGVKLFDERILDRTIGEKKDEAYEQIELLPVDKYDQLDIFGESNASRIMNRISKLQKEFFSCIDENQRIEIENKIDKYELKFVKETLKENNQQDKIKDIEAMWQKNTKPYFLWKLYFADVFLEKGGFDIVIGNPPYVGFHNVPNKALFKNKYYAANGKYDFYVLFIEQGIKLLAHHGIITYISPSYFYKRNYGKNLRRLILENMTIKYIADFKDYQIFDSALTYTCIFGFERNKVNENDIKVLNKSLSNRDIFYVNQSILREPVWIFENNNSIKILNKIKDKCPLTLGSIVKSISQGIVTGNNDVYYLNKDLIDMKGFNYNFLKRAYKGKDIRNGKLIENDCFLFYPYYLKNGKMAIIDESIIERDNPNLYRYLLDNKKLLLSREYFNKSNKKWYELWNPRDIKHFNARKFVFSEININNDFVLVNECYYTDSSCGMEIKDEYKKNEKYIFYYLNSKLMSYCYNKISVPKANGYLIYKNAFLKEFPIHLEKYDDFTNKYEFDKYLYNLFELKEDEISIVEEFYNRVEKLYKK